MEDLPGAISSYLLAQIPRVLWHIVRFASQALFTLVRSPANLHIEKKCLSRQDFNFIELVPIHIVVC